MSDTLQNFMPEWFHTLGPMGWPLLVCSILLTAVVIDRIMAYFKAKNQPEHMATEVWDKVAAFGPEPKALRNDRLEMALEDKEHQVFQGSGALKAIATISPMIGLLGTVIGIMISFQKIAQNQGPVTPNLIADGLWQAMSTTAFGIAIAILALVAGFCVQRTAENRLRQLAKTLNAKCLVADSQEG